MTTRQRASQLIALNAVVLLLVSCGTGWKQTNDRFLHSFKSLDTSEMLKVANSIGDRQIESRDGYKFLKLRITALQFAGRYRESLVTMENHRHQFANHVEFLIAMGRTAFWLGEKWNVYFTDAHQLLRQIAVQKMNQADLIYEYYLRLALKFPPEEDLLHAMKGTLDSTTLPLILRWASLSKSQLMDDGPISFVVPPKSDFTSMLGKKNGSSPTSPKAHWWEPKR